MTDVSRRRLPLTYAGASYFDSTRALEQGSVKPRNVDLTYVSVDDTSELFREVATAAPYSAAEMSLSTYLLLRAGGDDRLIAIPAFPSRSFRHGQVYVHDPAVIREPADLRGKRVGIPHYQMTSALWVRGFLEHDYGVKPSELQWWEGGLSTPAYEPRLGSRYDVPGVSIGQIPADRALEEMLSAGELDALISARVPTTFGSGVARLFNDYAERELEYVKRTRVFPIMHVVVLRADVYEENPWVAVALLDAFEEARVRARREIDSLELLLVMYPWLSERIAEFEAVVGYDPFAHGLETNRAAVETAISFSVEQGLARRSLSVEELFAEETLAWRFDGCG